MNFYAISSLVNIIALTILVVVLLIKRKTNRALGYFGIFNLFVLGWSLGYFFWQTSASFNHALFWVKFFMFTAIWTAPIFFHFVCVLIEKEGQKIPWIITSYFSAIPFSYLNFNSTLFIRTLEKKLDILFFPTAGPLFFLFLLQWAGWFAWAFFLIFRARNSCSNDEEKKFLKAIGVGTLISVACGSVNYFLWFNLPVPPITTMIVSLYGLVVSATLMQKKSGPTNLRLFELISATIVFVSLIQFVLGYLLDFPASQWLALGIILIITPILAANRLIHHSQLTHG